MTPEISVIIPTYNRAHYLPQTIDSVLAQTFTNYELIVVDDGSTDNTRAIITGYQKKHPHIQYLYQENAGGASARNLGWHHAGANYLFFFDSDDLLLPDALESLLHQAKRRSQAGAIGAGYQYIDAQGIVIGERKVWHNNSLDLQRWLTDCPFIPSATLVKKEWVACVSGFDPSQEAAQDWDFWLRLAYAGCPMVWLKQIVCQYRKHEQELTNDPQRQKRGSIRMFDKLFSQTDLPTFVHEQKEQLYAHVYITAAAREYMGGNIATGKEELTQAAILMPQWIVSGVLLEKVLRKAHSSTFSGDISVFQKRLLHNLPAELDNARAIKRGRARVAASELFTHYNKQEWAGLGSIWREVVQNDPTWLANTGIWLIGLRYLARRLREAV